MTRCATISSFRRLRASTLALSLSGALTVAADAAEVTYALTVANGRVPDNMRLVRVKQNDVVKLEWRTDKPLSVHLHGYDIEQELKPGTVTEMTFTARDRTIHGRTPHRDNAVRRACAWGRPCHYRGLSLSAPDGAGRRRCAAWRLPSRPQVLQRRPLLTASANATISRSRSRSTSPAPRRPSWCRSSSSGCSCARRRALTAIRASTSSPRRWVDGSQAPPLR